MALKKSGTLIIAADLLALGLFGIDFSDLQDISTSEKIYYTLIVQLVQRLVQKMQVFLQSFSKLQTEACACALV